MCLPPGNDQQGVRAYAFSLCARGMFVAGKPMSIE
jgi:hypothetical protein